MKQPLGTKIRALKEAKSLLQQFGFNGFSFQHIADALGIKKPSLYDHFSSKTELGVALVTNYHESFLHWTETIEIFGPKEKLAAYFEIFYKFSSDCAKICPVSTLINDYHTLPAKMQKQLMKMFLFQRQWIQDVVAEGQKQKLFRRDQNSKQLAALLIAIGFGAQMMARLNQSPGQIRELKDQTLTLLSL